VALQAARKPDSVLDDHSSRRRIAAALQQPTRRFRLFASSLRSPQNLSAWAHRADTHPPAGECGAVPCLFGLAPCGVYHASLLTQRPVRSYRTFSPLPSAACTVRLRRPSVRRRYILCCTGRPAALKRPSRTLSGTLPCGVRTFLPRSTRAHERQRSSSRLQSKCSS